MNRVGCEEPGLSDHKLIVAVLADRVVQQGATVRMIQFNMSAAVTGKTDATRTKNQPHGR